MPQHTVFTKLHDCLSSFSRPSTKRLKGSANDTSETEGFLRGFADLPHIVLHEGLLKDLALTPLLKSVTAMQQAGVLHLPYPRMALELWAGMPTERAFLILEELDHSGRFKGTMLQWMQEDTGPKGVAYSFSYLTLMELQWTRDETRPGTDADQHGFSVTGETKGGELDFQVNAILAGRAALIACAMTFIAGLEREEVECSRLNKHRQRSGKPSIPTHSILRIGHVYDSSGRKVAINDGNRRTMAIHMRAAHVRHQHHGAEWLAQHPEEAAKPTTTADTHLVLIPAVLVNYRDGTDLAKPLPKVVMA